MANFTSAEDEQDAALQRAAFVLPTNRAFVSNNANMDCMLRSGSCHLLSVVAHCPFFLLVDEPCTYLCGNSLGALPKKAEELVVSELKTWGLRCEVPPSYPLLPTF